MRFSLFALSLGLLALGLDAAPSSKGDVLYETPFGKPEPCNIHNDCNIDEVCLGGGCRMICDKNKNCDRGDQCLMVKELDFKVCQTPKALEREKIFKGMMRDCFIYGFTFPLLPRLKRTWQDPKDNTYQDLYAENKFQGPFDCAKKCQELPKCAVWTWLGGKEGDKKDAFYCDLRRLESDRTAATGEDLTRKWEAGKEGDTVISGLKSCHIQL